MQVTSATTGATPRDRAEHGSIQGLQRQGIEPRGTIHWNLLAPSLVEAAIRGGEGHLASGGPFAAITSPHVDRHPIHEHQKLFT